MAFVREDYARNESIPSAEEPWRSGTEVFLDRNQERSNSYLLLRKNLPQVFYSIKEYFNALETEKFCEKTLETVPNREFEIERCKSVHHGIMKMGISKTVDVMTFHFSNLHLMYKSNLNRSNEFLLKALRDPETIDFIEI